MTGGEGTARKTSWGFSFLSCEVGIIVTRTRSQRGELEFKSGRKLKKE